MPSKIIQHGKFIHGTYGFAVKVKTGADLTGATGITITLTPPDNGASIERVVPLENITDAEIGNFDFIPEDGDLSVAGIYTFAFEITFSDKVLTNEGVFGVG
jgi:hypothetical protein